MADILPPLKGRHNRACLLCSIIQSTADFRAHGCPNCEGDLRLKDNPERILTCTSQYFDGMIALIDPDRSWVAKWQRTRDCMRGIYAVRVKGRLPEDIESDLKDRGVNYRPRDLTINEEE